MPFDVIEMRRQVYRSKVTRRVAHPELLSWSKAVMPTLTDVAPLLELVESAGVDPHVLLTDFSGETSWRRARGIGRR